MDNATHVANPVRVHAAQILSVSHAEVEGHLNVRLSNGQFATLSPDMLARYTPEPGDYIVIQEDGYRYVNPREVFERKYQAIGQKVQFAADRECAAFLRNLADRIETSGDRTELCAVVYGTYGGQVATHTINSGLEAIGALQMGQRLMLDAIMPNPTTTGE